MKQIMLREDPQETLGHVLQLKTMRDLKVKWLEWSDDSELDHFVSKLQKEGVRLEGELILLWKHVPNSVMMYLPYFGHDSFSLRKDKRNGVKGWFGMRDMTAKDFGEKIDKDKRFHALHWPMEFPLQLWWFWSSNVHKKEIIRSDQHKVRREDLQEILIDTNVMDNEVNECQAISVASNDSNETDSCISNIWCTIHVQYEETESTKSLKLSDDQTGAEIMKQLQIDGENAYSRLYFDGKSLEKMITFPPEMTLSDFKAMVSAESADRDDVKYDDETPFEMTFVEIKELQFVGSLGTEDDDEVKWTLHDLMKTLGSKGIEFEENVLHLEWRPSVTDIQVDISYYGHREVINIKWPKWQQNDCESIMKIIRDSEEYRKMDIPDKEVGIPMLCLVVTKQRESEQQREPEPEPLIDIGTGLRYLKMPLNKVKAEIESRLPDDDHSKVDEDVKENTIDANPNDHIGDNNGTFIFESELTLHALIAKAYEENIRIHDHILLEWRFVPQKVVIQVPFEGEILSFKYILYASEDESLRFWNWKDVSRKKCSKIKKYLENDEEFKELKSHFPDNCSWDLWYIVNSKQYEESQQYVLPKSADTLSPDSTMDDDDDDHTDADTDAEQTPDALASATTRDIDDDDITEVHKKLDGPVLFQNDMTLEDFVLMLRRNGVEPGDALILEYRRVPGEIAVDLSYFDVNAEYSDIDMDWSCQKIMDQIGWHSLEEYGVYEKDGDPFLYLDMDCQWNSEDANTLRQSSEKRKMKKQKSSRIRIGKSLKVKRKHESKLKEQKRFKGKDKKRKKKKKKKKKSKHAHMPSINEMEATKSAELKQLRFDDPDMTLREFVENLRAKGIELESKMKLKWDHNISTEKKLSVKFELILASQTASTEKLIVHRFETHGKLVQRLKGEKQYEDWKTSASNTYNDSLCTLYFNSETAGSKASKMVIFEKQQTLQSFFDRLEEGMVATDALGAKDNVLTLQYMEGMLIMNFVDDEGLVRGTSVFTVHFLISGPKDKNTSKDDAVYYCSVCGNDVPRTLKMRDPKGQKHYYLNPHAILYFSRENHDKSEKLCPQCLYFSNLEIDTIDDGSQTTNQYLLIATGIFLSPAIWIAVALPISHEIFIFISIIAMVCSISLSHCK